MARNEEKQLGKLNRLWLQKEREEGHIKDVGGNRPKLSVLNTASDVKKWIPSIKNEINYYLEQSQLPHYPERKIEEFQEKIESLRKEYQSHLWKLRRLDPECKEHPWKPRGYTRKRTAEGRAPSWVESNPPGDKLLITPILNPTVKEDSDSEEEASSGKEERAFTPGRTVINPDSQDKPLVFNTETSDPKHVWLRSPYNTDGRETQALRDILLSDRPRQIGSVNAGSKKSRTGGGILGLDCYTSSDEES
ncbi:uncharacterized protein LOC128500405 [Spea bombifrons]|uniref:uncharacterized protein LOC128500405 n=1 Tax=Spea bombifrons TaxID=233779 RepID=UPI00234A67BD|nr:uncharacterized protein LOC128500405 [Spea bombifrons]